MKSFICLAISCLLVGLLYVYVRQQFNSQSAQIANLANMVRTMAEVTAHREVTGRARAPTHDESADEDSESEEEEQAPARPAPVRPEVDCRQEVSDDEESEDEKSDDEKSDVEDHPPETLRPPAVMDYLITVPPTTTMVLDISTAMEEVQDVVVLNHEEPALAKTVTLEVTNFAEWNMKALRDKIAQMGGPTAGLKTKKAMVEYLEKNVC